MNFVFPSLFKPAVGYLLNLRRCKPFDNFYRFPALHIDELSAEEFELLQDRDTPPKRLRLRDKMQDWLAELRDKLWQASQPWAAYYPEGTDDQRGKISRGEAYQSLPYQVLDYPRYLSANDVMTLRSLVLWGHDFSLHWILRGFPHQWYGPVLAHRVYALQQQGWAIGVGNSPWVWEADPQYYQPATAFSPPALQEHLLHHHFLKLTRRWPFERLGQVPDEAPRAWQALQQLIWGRQSF
jgi:hypothetical protein